MSTSRREPVQRGTPTRSARRSSSPTIGRQLLELGLIDEIDLHIAPILLGAGIRLYDNPGSAPIRLHGVGAGDPASVVNVRYRPATSGLSG